MRLYFYVLGTVLSLGVAVGSQSVDSVDDQEEKAVEAAHPSPLDSEIRHQLSSLYMSFLQTKMSLREAKQRYIENWYKRVAPSQRPDDLEACARDLTRLEKMDCAIEKIGADLLALEQKIQVGSDF